MAKVSNVWRKNSLNIDPISLLVFVLSLLRRPILGVLRDDCVEIVRENDMLEVRESEFVH